MCVCLVAANIRENFEDWSVGAWVLGYLDGGNGKGSLLVSFRWLYSLNRASFLCVCLVAEEIRVDIGDWNVGAWVLGFLDVGNGKDLLLASLRLFYSLNSTF